MKSVYIVQGATGEFDDYREWVAAICTSKPTANAVCKRLTAVVSSVNSKYLSTAQQLRLEQALREAGDALPSVDAHGVGYEVVGPLAVVNSVKEL